MDVVAEDPAEMGASDGIVQNGEVANDPTGRHHGQRSVAPPAGDRRRPPQRGPDESSAGPHSTHSTPEDKEKADKDKGRKRRKSRRARPNKKLWLRRKDEAGGVLGAAPGALSPSLARARAGMAGSSALPSALPAPNNTTQFIMEDHTDLPVLDLDTQRGSKTTRARDSSFSVDSDEDLSASPEDEAYLSKEFSNTYEDVHVERLGTMTKLGLVQEYLQLEQRIDTLEKRLKSTANAGSGAGDSGGTGGTGTDSDSEVAEGEMPMEPAMAEKIRIFQAEIRKLVVENEQLVQENQRLQSSSSLVRPSSSSLSSSVDSESDSSTSSGSSTTSSSGQSGASQSSRTSKCSDHNQRTEFAADVEMTSMEDYAKTPTDPSYRNSEASAGELSPKSPHEDSSLVSPVAAH